MPGKVVDRKRLDPNLLTLSPNNCRVDINPHALNMLIISVRNFDEVLEPLIINTRKEVVAGQRRWLAAKEVGIDVDCIVKEYSGDDEEMIDSLVENETHRDVSAREKGNIVIKLHDEYDKTFEEIGDMVGRNHTTIQRWYKKAKVPKPIMPRKIDEKKEKEKKEKKEEKEEKEEEEPQKTLEEIHEETEEERREREAREEAAELWKGFGIRTCNVLRRIIESSEYKDNVLKCLKLLKYAKEYLPLRELENIAKDIKKGLPSDLEYRKKIYEHKEDFIMRSIRIRKELLTDIKPILKRRQINLHHAIDEALRDWRDKWKLPEDWEEPKTKSVPSVLK